MNTDLDCVIVGYNDRDFRGRLAAVRGVRGVSGAYESMRLQSVPFRDERITYMELMNSALTRAWGRDVGLHIGKIPSLGAWYLWNFLTKNGYRAHTINSFNADHDEFVDVLRHRPPLAVAITTTFYVDDAPIREIADLTRELSPDTRVIVGGPHIFNIFETHAGDEEKIRSLMIAMAGDVYIMDSQGELTLCRVLSWLRGEERAHEPVARPAAARMSTNSLAVLGERRDVSTRSLHTIPNVVFLEDDRVVHTDRVLESNDMDEFSIDWDLVNPRHFAPTATTRTARSCAFACSFCRFPIIAGPLNLKSLDAVIRQFDQFERHGVRHVIIIDDTFNVPLPRFKDLCRAVAARRYSFDWYSYFRASNADMEAIDLAAESGCGGVFLGIESGDQNILTAMNKAANVDKYARGIEELNRRGVITFASMIVGFPGETRETVDNTIAFLNACKPRYWRPGLYFHSNTTPIQARAAELEIRGAAFSWSHRTMDWRGALAERARMLHDVTESTFLPGYNFDFWAIPYLLGNGVTKHQHHRFCSLAQECLLRELGGERVDVSCGLDQFAEVFREGAPAPTTEHANGALPDAEPLTHAQR